MSQYTPFYKSSEYPEINRRITSYEYNKVVDTAIDLGLTEGFMQERSSAKKNIRRHLTVRASNCNMKSGYRINFLVSIPTLMFCVIQWILPRFIRFCFLYEIFLFHSTGFFRNLIFLFVLISIIVFLF